MRLSVTLVSGEGKVESTEERKQRAIAKWEARMRTEANGANAPSKKSGHRKKVSFGCDNEADNRVDKTEQARKQAQVVRDRKLWQMEAVANYMHCVFPNP